MTMNPHFGFLKARGPKPLIGTVLMNVMRKEAKSLHVLVTALEPGFLSKPISDRLCYEDLYDA